MKRWILRALVAGVVAFVGLQLLPFGRIEERAVTQEAPWASVEARRLAVAACYDCHSNEPQLEWFDEIAPGSWLVARHVADGRAQVNFSEWDRDQGSDDWADVVEDREMPPASYARAHPTARLTEDERHLLLEALEQLEEPDEDEGGRGDDEG